MLCGMQIGMFFIFVGYTRKLKMYHPPHDNYLVHLVMYRVGQNSLADRRLKANLTYLRRFIDGIIDSLELLKQINVKALKL